MKNIKWKKGHYSSETVYAETGNIHLRCFHRQTSMGRSWWYCSVYLGKWYHAGPTRYSLVKAQEDAVRICEELLIDLHTALEQEMKSCGVEANE